MMDKFSCAIFDLDGTILESTHVWEEIDNEFLGRRGIKPPKDYLDEIKVHNFESGAVYTIERFGFKETPSEILNEWYNMAEYHYSNDIVLKPHAREYLEYIKSKGIKIAAATANCERLFAPCLKKNEIYNLFDNFTETCEVERRKGFPDVYIKAMEKCNEKVSNCVVFEDILAGIKGAKDGGFYTVAVYDSASQGDTDDIKKESNKYIVDFKELL